MALKIIHAMIGLQMTLVKYTTRPCPWCHEVTHLEVDPDKLSLWRSGIPIQRVWPEQDADWRELMITGTHAECWNKMFLEEREKD